jgi:single-stranded-DNA-specific exonuclease
MELKDENRILVREGLLALHHTQKPGLLELILQNQLEPEDLDVYHIGFILGPCLNASGRLDTAARALRLMMAETRQEAAPLAQELISLNASRKEMTVKGEEEAVRLVEESDLIHDRVLVVFMPDCHESLAGIIAGRLKEHFYPAFFRAYPDGRRSEGVRALH